MTADQVTNYMKGNEIHVQMSRFNYFTISNIYRKVKNYNPECRTIEFGQVLKSTKYNMKNISVNLINVGLTFAKTIST